MDWPNPDDEIVMVPEWGPDRGVLTGFWVFLEVIAHKGTADDQGTVLRSRQRQRTFDETCTEAGALQGGWNLGVHQNERVRAPLVGDKGDVPIFNELEAAGFWVIANVFGFALRIPIHNDCPSDCPFPRDQPGSHQHGRFAPGIARMRRSTR